MIGLIVTLLLIGFLWWLAETYVPMPPPMRLIVRVVCLVGVVWYVLAWFGVLGVLTARP